MQCLQKSQSSGSVLSVRYKESTKCILRAPPMARGRVQTSASLEPRFQLIERRFRPIVLDAVRRKMQKMAMNAGLLGVSQVIFAVLVEGGAGSRPDREQTLLRVLLA